PEPAATRHEYPIAAIAHDTPRFPLGPTALPGRYSVRLTANGKSYTATLTVKMDPRVQISETALAKKFRAEVHLAAVMTKTSQAVLQGESLRDHLPTPKNQS